MSTKIKVTIGRLKNGVLLLIVNSIQIKNKYSLGFLKALVEDMDGYFYNMGENIPQNIDWKFFATLLYVVKIYE